MVVGGHHSLEIASHKNVLMTRSCPDPVHQFSTQKWRFLWCIKTLRHSCQCWVVASKDWCIWAKTGMYLSIICGLPWTIDLPVLCQRHREHSQQLLLYVVFVVNTLTRCDFVSYARLRKSVTFSLLQTLRPSWFDPVKQWPLYGIHEQVFRDFSNNNNR